MVTLKRTLALTLAAVSLFSFTACSKKATTDTSSTTVGNRTASLRFSWWGGDSRTQATLDVIKQFEQKYPKITIEGEYGSSTGYNDKLATQLSAGTSPDIVQIDPGYFSTYVSTNKNYFIDFKKYSAMDLTGFDAAFLKDNGYMNGKQLGLPTGVSGYAMIENKTLADKIGVDLTKQYTWDDLIAMGAKVKNYDKSCYLLASNLSTGVDNILRPYVRQLTGHALLLDDSKKLGVTQAQLTQVFTLFKSLYDNNVIPPESHMASYEDDNIAKDPNWISGKYVAATCISSTILVFSAANKNVTYTATKMPLLKNGTSQGYYTSAPQYMSVSSKSQYIPEAVAFLNYFFNNKDAAKTLGVQRSVPPVKSSRQVCDEAGLVDTLTGGAVDASQSYNGKSDVGFTTSSEVKSILEDSISSIAYGKSDPSAVATKTITLLNNYLANQK